MRILKHFRKLLQKLKILLFKRKKRTISLVILLIIFMAVFSLVKGKTNLAIAPMTSIVTKEDIEYRVKVNGVVKSLNEQTVLSAIQGQVENIYFNQGDAVHKGDILATIDTTEIDSKIQKSVIQLELEKSKLMNSQEEMNSAKVTLSETEQKYNFYKETYESKLKLFEVGAISKMDLDESKLSLDEIYNKYLILKDSLENGSYTQNLNLQQKQVHLAESEHASLIKEKEKHFIGSPIDGIIAERYIQQGDIISPQKQLFYVVNNNQLEVTANVSEYDAKNIQKGNKVTITSDGIVEYSYESEISFVSPIAKNIQSSNSNESVVEVKTIITDDNLALKSGFNVYVDILCDRKENVLTVPYESILTTKDGKQFVFVVKEGSQEQHEVETGIEGSLKVEVTSETLQEGDVLLKNVHEGLLDSDESKAGQKNDND